MYSALYVREALFRNVPLLCRDLRGYVVLPIFRGSERPDYILLREKQSSRKNQLFTLSGSKPSFASVILEFFELFGISHSSAHQALLLDLLQYWTLLQGHIIPSINYQYSHFLDSLLFCRESGKWEGSFQQDFANFLLFLHFSSFREVFIFEL